MTGHPRSPGTEQGARVTLDRTDPDLSVEDEVPDEMLWPGADLDAPPEASNGWDAEIAAAAKGLFFARELVRPGPGLLPFGARAHDRRERRRQVDTLAATRRAELSELLTARRNSRGDRSGGTARRGRPRVVAALLTAVVIGIALAGWWTSLTATPPSPSQDPAGTGSVATGLAQDGSNPTTFEAATPAAAYPQPGPATVDLISPAAAAASWLTAWCPIDPHRNPDAVAAGIRGAMTAEGWARFAAPPGQMIMDAAHGVTASCSTPRARVVSRPPGSDTTVVVLVSATRTVTSPDNASATRSFRLERRQYVVRGDDSLWRVDVPAVGG